MEKKREFVLLYPICALLFSLYVLTHPLQCSFYSKKALDICFTTLVPTLFPFVFASNFFACVMPERTGENRITKFLSELFGVPPSLVFCVLFGLFSGFPSGAVFVTKMYERGLCTKKDSIRAVCLSNNCSASFLISVAGITVLGSTKQGVMLLVCQIFSVITCAQILKCIFKSGENISDGITPGTPAQNPHFSKAFTDSIKNSSLSMLYISGFVVFFYTLSSILCDTFFPTSDIFRAISGTVFEISTGALASSNLDFPMNALLCAFCICFPSMSVMFQIKSICDEHFDITKQYIFCRICMSFFSAISAYIILYSGLLTFLLLIALFFCLCSVILPLIQSTVGNRVKNVQKKL